MLIVARFTYRLHAGTPPASRAEARSAKRPKALPAASQALNGTTTSLSTGTLGSGALAMADGGAAMGSDPLYMRMEGLKRTVKLSSCPRGRHDREYPLRFERKAPGDKFTVLGASAVWAPSLGLSYARLMTVTGETCQPRERSFELITGPKHRSWASTGPTSHSVSGHREVALGHGGPNNQTWADREAQRRRRRSVLVVSKSLSRGGAREAPGILPQLNSGLRAIAGTSSQP